MLPFGVTGYCTAEVGNPGGPYEYFIKFEIKR
jgi:hypothetical protein